MIRTFAIAALVGSAMAACPNGCSGNGICGANDKCSCYQNWQGPDCSQRTCTYSLAWADTADGTNQAHYYAECSNKGVCDRKTGECKCFDGYEGKGCRRSTCPEGCSGHGTCEYIDELAVDFYNRRGGPVNAATTATSAALSNYVTDSDSSRSFTGFLYQLWDAQKIQGCKCDLGYSGPDCAGRVAPKGDDPLTTVKSTMMTQAVRLGAATLATVTGVAALTDVEFYMVYHDPYGGVWRTDGIAGTADDDVVATRVQSALRALPNEVLEGVSVVASSAAQSICTRATDGAQHIPSAGGHGTTNACTDFSAGNAATTLTGAAANTYMDFLVTFADKPGQTGTQFLFEVNTEVSADGAYPKSKGFNTATSSGTTVEGKTVVANVHEVIAGTTAAGPSLGAISELAECSDRGLDNGDGECECFDGFRGLACEEQEALV